ncbi:hypothetical protein GQ44DRAFT_731128 [Phaeosphaeriaceae sp. PMI808]|nr:hypothetical protein GQ44DRAFT_731128 [Phaeosphaeriaceae sp. PMI808]
MLTHADKGQSGSSSVRADHHVQHLSTTVWQFLRMHASFNEITVALTPLVIKNKYQFAHIILNEGWIVYHKTENEESFACELAQGPYQYSKQAAINHAQDELGEVGVFLTTRSGMKLSEGDMRAEMAAQFPCESLGLHFIGTTDIGNLLEDESFLHCAIEKQIRQLDRPRLRTLRASRL